MLPFSSDRQAKRVRQDNNVSEELWNARRAVIRAEHRAATARTELEQSWKQRLIDKARAGAGSAAPDAAAPAAVQDGELQFDD